MHTLLQKPLSNPEKESHSSQGLRVSNKEKCLHRRGLRRAHCSNMANPRGLSQRAVCPSACSPLPRSALGSSSHAVSVQTPSHPWLRAPHPDLRLCPSELPSVQTPVFPHVVLKFYQQCSCSQCVSRARPQTTGPASHPPGASRGASGHRGKGHFSGNLKNRSHFHVFTTYPKEIYY